MAAREKVADKNVATTELAAVLGISARRVQQLAQDGILDTVERGKFELGAAVQAYIRFLGRDAMTEEDKKLESAKRKAEATLMLKAAGVEKVEETTKSMIEGGNEDGEGQQNPGGGDE